MRKSKNVIEIINKNRNHLLDSAWRQAFCKTNRFPFFCVHSECKCCSVVLPSGTQKHSQEYECNERSFYQHLHTNRHTQQHSIALLPVFIFIAFLFLLRLRFSSFLRIWLPSYTGWSNLRSLIFNTANDEWTLNSAGLANSWLCDNEHSSAQHSLHEMCGLGLSRSGVSLLIFNMYWYIHRLNWFNEFFSRCFDIASRLRRAGKCLINKTRSCTELERETHSYVHAHDNFFSNFIERKRNDFVTSVSFGCLSKKISLLINYSNGFQYYW